MSGNVVQRFETDIHTYIHVSVQAHHLQGAHFPYLLKLHFIKIVSMVHRCVIKSVQHTHTNKDLPIYVHAATSPPI